MKTIFISAVIVLSVIAAQALVLNPIVDTDRSVNTFSLQTIVKDVVHDTMTPEQKLRALYIFHRRMVHHNRLKQNTEDNLTVFDPVKLYTVYGCAWCTQQSCIFRTLCAEVFGWENTMEIGSQGPVQPTRKIGGHSSFHLRFNAHDKWHWVDPPIGAFALTRTDRTIASLEDIAQDPFILIDAQKENRASVPYFPCAVPPDPIPPDLEGAYSYFAYDTGFIAGYAKGWKDGNVKQPAYFTTRKTLKKGETYYWLWDYLPGDYFNVQDREFGKTRDWQWYPPRHLCGWKDSLDTVNWSYFKPYEKEIKGVTYYRYYANGVHLFEPDFTKGDSLDDACIRSNIVSVRTTTGRMIAPVSKGKEAELAYRIKLPYPLMSMAVSARYVRKSAADSVVLSIARIYFDIDKAIIPKEDRFVTAYADTESAENFQDIALLPVKTDGTFEADLRKFVDPLETGRTFQGYLVRFRLKSAGKAADAGLKSFRVKCIFQHNMFALPQFEPGMNKIRVTTENGTAGFDRLKLGFGYMDNGVKKELVRPVKKSGDGFDVTVAQKSVPKMLYMWLGNTEKSKITY
ncbi:MAG: hypothetical protein V1913_00365 [Fibrobacterota bacterium]